MLDAFSGRRGLTITPFDPPLYETFAFVWRNRTTLAPATKQLVELAEGQMRRFGKPVLSPERAAAAPGADPGRVR